MDRFLAAHHAWLVFVGAFVFGETLIIPAAALAAQGYFSVWVVAGSAYLGTVVSDALWFRLSGLAERYLAKHTDRWYRFRRVLVWLDRRFGSHPERALLFIKFVYGTRLATIVYLALRKLQLRVFLAFNGVGTAPWIAVIVGVGWLVGEGVSSLVPELGTVERLLPVVLGLALLLKGMATWISKRALAK